LAKKRQAMASGPWHSPLFHELLGCRPDYIEHQLAHSVRDPNGCTYNLTAHLPEHKMMQDWADYLDKLKPGAEIILI